MTDNSWLFRNIKTLAGIVPLGAGRLKGAQMADIGLLHDAWLLVKDGKIADFGPMADCPQPAPNIREKSLAGQLVLAGFVDCHTHIAWAGSRENEFVMRLKGATYEEISAAGGGILNSVRQVAATGDEELLAQTRQRLERAIATGTTTIEIKSGYGLSVELELKLLRLINRLKETSPIRVVRTFLGAHSFPMEYRQNHQGYIDIVIDQMLPRVAQEGLAEYVDVFCERGFYSPAEAEQVLLAGKKLGLKMRMHANQLAISGGVQKAVELGVLSADHLEHIGEEEIGLLAGSEVMPVLLPGVSLFLNLPYAPARELMKAGAPVALATDCNPGTSPVLDMKLMWSLACTQMKMTPAEAFSALTINGAAALGIEGETGSITRGKSADLIITKPVPSFDYLPYSIGEDWVETTLCKGVENRRNQEK